MDELATALDEIAKIGGRPAYAADLASLRHGFEERTGPFRAEDPWFEARSRAFWDDAITRQDFGRKLERDLSPASRAWLDRLARAHRGLFVVAGASPILLRDLWGGAEFYVDQVDDGLRDALRAAESPFDGRLVGSAAPARVALLSGAVFHPPDAAPAMEEVLKEARRRAMGKDDALDALLRMERSFRSLSRVKPGYAYRLR